MKPIPAIKNQREFIARYDEVLDNALFNMIIRSSPAKDWSAVGWKGIMLANGELWLNYDGKIIGVNYLTESEKKMRTDLITAQRAALYESVRDFVEPVLEWATRKYRIRIDDMGEGRLRYASWLRNKPIAEKPDLVLLDGKLEFDGNGGNHHYTFSKGGYSYVCDVRVLREDAMPPGELDVYFEGKLILSDPVVEDLLDK